MNCYYALSGQVSSVDPHVVGCEYARPCVGKRMGKVAVL